MNYYNPYYAYPYITSATSKPGILRGLFSGLKGINFSSILSGTQKTLGIVNQTIPLIKQATPVFKNAKTMFKVMNEFKKVDIPVKNKVNLNNKENNIKAEVNDYVNDTKLNEGPTFFL